VNVGVWSKTSGGQKGAVLGTNNALLKVTTGGTVWGGGTGASLVFNMVGWLSGISNSTSTGRMGNDFGIAHANLAGTVHTSPSTILVSLRANGPLGGPMTVFLLVGGSPALYQGVFVSATVTLTGSGNNQIATLTWEAPSSGSYSLSFIIYPSSDIYALNNQLPLSALNLATTFT
jgi:hypothetical protein